MHSLEKKIKFIICESELVVAGDVVLVGVSGGADSTALLLILSWLRGYIDFSIVAVYVDHGLRPDETPAEKDFLYKLCEDLCVPLVVEVVDVAREALVCKESVEQAARKLRYRVFVRLAESYGGTKVAVGHTADDQAEEVVLRLLRGTARAGLSGMKLIRDNLIIRPLLEVTKSDIYLYLQERKMSFMEDSSNSSPVYLRNQVRLQVLPFLRQYNPAIDDNLRNLALILQDEEGLLSQQTDHAWGILATVTCAKDGLSMVQWGCAEFSLLHVALQRRVAEKMFICMESSPSADKIKQLLYLINHGQGGGSLHFAHGLRALKKKGRMCFWYPQGKTNQKGDLFERSRF